MKYSHLPEPPRSIQQIALRPPLSPDSVSSINIEQYPVYALQHIDGNGCRTTQICNLTEYLWHVIQQHCRHCCHNLHVSLRGSWKCVIHSGGHDSKVWTYYAKSWNYLILKITLDLLPGYWTPSWTTLSYFGDDPAGHSLARLMPGESIAFSENLASSEDPVISVLAELNGRTISHVERLLENITGSAYHLVIRPAKTGENYHERRLSKTIVVQRLQHSLEGSTTRAFVSPDRRHYYQQDPHTGLYHFKS